MEKKNCFKVVVGQAMPDVKKDLSCPQAAPLLSSRSVGMRDIRDAIKNFAAPIPRIETLRGDEARGSGFTLIELLVVVLIIGILAAVALPQYKIAVAKSRMTQLQIRFNAIEKAVQIYFMANNTFPNDVRDLDIDIEEQGAQYAHLSSLTGDESAKGLVYLNGDQCGTVLFRGKARLICSNRDLAIRNDYINYPTITARYCAAWTAQGEKICKSLSKNQTIDTTYDSGFHQYVLD